MAHRFQVTLHGTGFSVPVDGGDPVCGFYAIRRILAQTTTEAEQQAIAELQQEAKFRWMIETTKQKLGSSEGCSVRLESIRELSRFSWHFSRNRKSFIFYR
jgi:hypothetical protein